MSYIGKIKAGGAANAVPVGSTLYGSCGSEASATAKSVTLEEFDTLITGVTVHVKFVNANTADSPTLAVGSTEAKSIAGMTNWRSGDVVTFTYDGTNWVSNDTRVEAASGSVNGTIAIDGANVAVTGLQSAAYKQLATNGVTDGDTGLVTADEVHDYVTTHVATAFEFKGVQATVSALPSSGNKTGDVWHVTEDGNEYVWTGTAWEAFGSYFDFTTTNVATAVVDKTDAANVVTGVKLSTGAVATLTSTNTTVTAGYSTASAAWPTIGATGREDVLGSVKTAGTLPTFTPTPATVINSATAGTLPSLTTTAATVAASTYANAGTAPSFTKSSANVVSEVTGGTGVVAEGILTLTDVASSSAKVLLSASTFDAGSFPTLGSTSVVGTASLNSGAMPTFTSTSVIGTATFSQGAMPTFNTATVLGTATTLTAGTWPTAGTESVVSTINFSANELQGITLTTAKVASLVDVSTAKVVASITHPQPKPSVQP